MSFNWVKYKAPCLSRRLLPNCNASSGCKKERNKRVGISKRICCNHQRSTYIYVYLYVIEISRNSIVVCLRFGGKYRLEEVMVRRWIHMVVTPKLVEYGKWWMCYGFGSIPLPILAFSLGTLFLLRLPTRLVQQASPLFAFVLRSVSLSFLLFLFIFLSSFFFSRRFTAASDRLGPMSISSQSMLTSREQFSVVEPHMAIEARRFCYDSNPLT